MMKPLYLFILPIIILSSCLEELEMPAEKAVIDGWIDSNGYPVVIFTSSVTPGENLQSISDKIVRWGKVTISDGVDTIIMTGGIDSNYIPPYKYYTYQMKGEPGKTYHITAKYNSLQAEAECIMPNPTSISSVELYPIEGNDSLRSGELKFITPYDCPAYYYVSMRKTGEKGRFLPTVLGTYIALTPGTEAAIPLFSSKSNLVDIPYISQLKLGDTIEFKLCRVTKEVYDFWSDYENSLLFGGTQFFDTSISLQGNVVGGFGIWSAQGTDTLAIEIK